MYNRIIRYYQKINDKNKIIDTYLKMKVKPDSRIYSMVL